MVKLTAGVVIGIVLGSAVSAFAVAGWYDGKGLLSHTEEFQNGYVAGVSDALDAIVDAAPGVDYLRAKLECLDTPDKTNRLGDFRVWAAGRLDRHPDSQAASVIMADACEP